MCLTQDSCRAVVGCMDGKVYIYDVHSGKLLKTLTGQSGEVTAVKVTEKDDYLLTAGMSIILFYFYFNLLILSKRNFQLSKVL